MKVKGISCTVKLSIWSKLHLQQRVSRMLNKRCGFSFFVFHDFVIFVVSCACVDDVSN
jgi:hypothetical protein